MNAIYKTIGTGIAVSALWMFSALGIAQGAPPAVDSIQTFKNQGSGRCIGDSSRGLLPERCDGTKFQKWNVSHVGAYSVLRNVATNACIDDSHHGLRAHPCNDQDYQKWLAVGDGTGAISLGNKKTRKCLDDSVSRLTAEECKDGAFQLWR
ncbi:RICIN domain-containing protein [Streptomyces sp. A5-4]|uniref:RICIN domain-containing protein n=1 Tax=Streptomyces sp. A5-4 TaxID=3384771 RepID=UPI003DA82419